MSIFTINRFPANKKFQLTKSGLDSLKKELDNLRAERFDLVKSLRFLDPKEKSETIMSNDTIKNLEIIENKVANIDYVLNRADIVHEESEVREVHVGSIVNLSHDGELLTYIVVDPIEANPIDKKISKESPLGRALIGRKVREFIDIVTPKGIMQHYRVVSIS